MNKAEWIKKEQELQNKFDEAQVKFNAKPCKKTATILSNLREELKNHNLEGYEGRDEEVNQKLIRNIAQIFDFVNNEKETLSII